MARESNETRVRVAQIEAMTKYETTQRDDPEQFDEEMAEKRRQFDERLGLDRDKLELERRKQGESERQASAAESSRDADRAQREAQSARSEANKAALASMRMEEDRREARLKGKEGR